MSRTEISSIIAAANAAANAAVNIAGNSLDGRRSEAYLNSARIEVVADKLAIHAASSAQKDEPKLFFQLCLSLARGIDYGVANNEVPEKASKLPPILKQVCRRKTELLPQAAIMVLLISVKNACKMGWFTAKDTEELLSLTNEVGSYFSTMGEINSEVSILPTVSTIMSRFYPQFKMGNVIASLEVKPGYGTYLLDFQISKNVPYSPDEKIRLFVAMKDSIETSSCIISPQKVNLLLNGKAVDKRTNISMDQGPQFPTAVNQQLKYGTNLLQAVGHFSGHCIIVIAFMSIVQPSTLPVPPDYVQADTTTVSSESDSEIIEGPSRISLNCPISCKRIGTPVKGHLCKHYQCFDLSNYLELNSKRPSWRCPQCNQSVCFTDLRVDQRMAKVLQEVEENVSEVIISVDGSWTAASIKNHKYESNHKASVDQQEQHERPDPFGTDTCKVYDLTEADNDMEIVDNHEEVDIKPVIHHNVQNQPIPSNISPINNSLVSDTLQGNTNSKNGNIRLEVQTENAVSRFRPPVLIDSVSPRLPDSFPGTNYPTNSAPRGQFSASNSSHLSNIPHAQSVMGNDFGGFQGIPRNVTRTPSAIQALPVPRPSSPHQQYLRPNVSSHTIDLPSSQFQVPLPSNLHSSNAMSAERQQYIHRTIANAIRSASPQNHLASPRMVAHHSTPNQTANARMPHMMPQTLSQPPHLRSSSQVPQNYGPQGVSHGGPGFVTMEPIQLTAQHPPQMRHHSQTTQTPQMRHHSQTTQPPHMRQNPQTAPFSQMRQNPQTAQFSQMRQNLQVAPHQMRQNLQTTPPPQNPQTAPPQMRQNPQTTPALPPQAVSRTENLINLESEQNWRPTGRMRGALTGQAYSDALNRFFGPDNQPTEQTSTPQISPHLQAMASRMNPHISQVLNHRPPNNASNGSGAPGGFN